MRILFVTESLGLGGAEHALCNLMLNLQEQGVCCEVAALMGRHELAGKLEGAGIKVHRVNIGHRWSILSARRSLSKIVSSETFDVVHAHLFFADIFVGILSPRGYVKVATLHNLGYEGDHDSAWRRMRKKLHSWILRKRFHGVLGVSAAVARHYERELGLPEVKVIPNGLPLKVIRSMATGDRMAIRRKHSLPEDSVVLVVPARLVPEKGHFLLFEALEVLRQVRSDEMRSVITILVGSGPLRAEIADFISARAWNDSVRMISALPQTELFPLIAASDLYVSSSVSEGLPLAVIEAAAIGIPIVATRIGGVPDVVEDGKSGTLSAPGDSAALAEAIHKALESRENGKHMAEVGRKFVAERFDVKVVATQLLSYYSKLIERNGLRCVSV